MLSACMGETQENWGAPWGGWSNHVQYYFTCRQKMMLRGGSHLRDVTRKSTVSKGNLVADVSLCLLHWMEFLETESYPPLWGTAEETPWRWRKSFLFNRNVSYKRVASTPCSELPLCVLFLKNSQPKINPMPKRHASHWTSLNVENGSVQLNSCVSF